MKQGYIAWIGMLVVIGTCGCRLQPSSLREGDILSVVEGSGVDGHGKRLTDHAVVKVISLTGDGCCGVYATMLSERPRHVEVSEFVGYTTVRRIRERWDSRSPVRIDTRAVTDDERRACAEANATISENVIARCQTPVRPAIDLSAVEACRLELLRQRCEGLDACIVHCMARGRDRVGQDVVVAGGCLHLCAVGESWEEPEGWEDCATRSNEPSSNPRHP